MKKNEKYENSQKIECSVADCTHNCIKDSTCRLDKIRVCPCISDEKTASDESTQCSSYHYLGDLNAKESID